MKVRDQLRILGGAAVLLLACATGAMADIPAPPDEPEADAVERGEAQGEASAEGVVADAISDDDDSAAVDLTGEPGPVRVLRFENYMINRGTEQWFTEELQAAEDDGAGAFVLVLDTPGGSVDSMETMVKAELAATVPVIVYVSPSGGAASSAGTFITMAAHVAAMAPATTIGAAHPVFAASPGGGGDEEDEDGDKAANKASTEEAMLAKVTNHLVATVRNIAEERGRNADWGERAVREAVAIGVDEAVELDVVDLKAVSLRALLDAVDGRAVVLAAETQGVVRTGGELQERSIPLRLYLLMILGNPTVAFGLLSLGMTLLVIEGKSGMIVPGVAGITCLVVAAFGMSFVPVNVLSLLLVIIGFGLLLAEIYVGSFGLLGVGGVAAIAWGGLFLVKETPAFDVGVSPVAVGSIVVMAALTVALLATLVYRAEKRQAQTGLEGMAGERGVVRKAIPGGRDHGRVFVRSELWSARAAEPIAQGAEVTVVAVDGLVLDVEARS
ncbi:MAG: nodulation protein NfeD [Deltaproteobacteria bacterium]|nr:nodulation protein NfeD [Deltaproteobacteria bacterium]